MRRVSASSSATRRGVKMRLTSLRMAVCSGGSSTISVCSVWFGPRDSRAMPSVDVYVTGSRNACWTSSYLLSAQKRSSSFQ